MIPRMVDLPQNSAPAGFFSRLRRLLPPRLIQAGCAVTSTDSSSRSSVRYGSSLRPSLRTGCRRRRQRRSSFPRKRMPSDGFTEWTGVRELCLGAIAYWPQGLGGMRWRTACVCTIFTRRFCICSESITPSCRTHKRGVSSGLIRTRGRRLTVSRAKRSDEQAVFEEAGGVGCFLGEL